MLRLAIYQGCGNGITNSVSLPIFLQTFQCVYEVKRPVLVHCFKQTIKLWNVEQILKTLITHQGWFGMCERKEEEKNLLLGRVSKTADVARNHGSRRRISSDRRSMCFFVRTATTVS